MCSFFEFYACHIQSKHDEKLAQTKFALNSTHVGIDLQTSITPILLNPVIPIPHTLIVEI